MKKLFAILTVCSIILFAPGCKKSSGTPTSNGNSNGPFYYKATIGGTYFEVLTKSAPTGPADYWSGSGMGGQQTVNFSSDISPLSTDVPPGYTILQVTKGILFDYFVATNATVKSFFSPGTYSYIKADSVNFPNANGISILWGDKEGKLWRTTYGSADQTGSTFKIISAEEYNEPSGLYALKVKMQFNCKLYKEGIGEMKLLTNGEMVGLFARVR